MEIPQNSFKRALRASKAQIGLWATLSSNYTTEVIAGAGFDWILIDTEHSPADLENVLAQLQAAAAYPAAAVVRVPWNDMVTIKRYLDIGVQSLLIPQVTTVQEAKNAVAYARYPTGGLRGVAGATRATRFGRIAGYFPRAHEEICVLVQVESGEALNNIDASLSYLGERAHAEVMPRIDDAIARIVGTGKAAGILTDSEAHARHWLSLGALFVAVGSDVGLLARAADALAARFKP